MASQPKRVALVHDWLTNQGGGERVLWQLHMLYPEAPIFTSVYDPARLPEFGSLDIRTSFLQKLPLARRRHQLFPLLRTLAFESFDFSQFDLVISTSSAEAKGVITPPTTLHLAYLFTPTRYYWSGYHNYLADPGFGALNPIMRRVMPRLISRLRQWDYAAAQRPDRLLADSGFVADRIAKYYRRPATVVYAPVDVERFDATKKRGDHYLVVSRLVPYKRIDLAIAACNELKRPLLVVGKGSELAKLRRLAGPTVTFLEGLSDAAVAGHYGTAKALIFPGEEDFGITPLEAMASGCPVIAYGRGGVLETVRDGQTGIFFNEPSVASLVGSIKDFESLRLDSKEIRQRAEDFSNEHFATHFKEIVDERWSELLKRRG